MQQAFTLNIYCQNPCVDIRPPIFTHRKRGKGLGAQMIEGKQPVSRSLYVDFMRGVDVADQKIQTHIADHKPRNYFWRRVFVHKLYQAMVNAHVLFMTWCTIRLAEARNRISELRDQLTSDTRNEIESLEQVAKKLDTLSRTERLAWDRALSHSLMAKCKVGHAWEGKRGRKPSPAVPSTPGI